MTVQQIRGFAALLVTCPLVMAASSPGGDVPIAGVKAPAVQVVVASPDALMQRTGAWCRDFLAKRGYSVKPAVASRLPKGSNPVWVLETLDSDPVAKTLKVDVGFFDSARADAYILTVTERGNRPWISIVGRTPVGVRSGVARLVALMKEDGTHLTVLTLSERRSPYFRVRRLILSQTGRIAKGPPWNDTLWTKWSDERIRSYVEALWLCGFNSLEVAECRGYAGVFSDEQLKNEITPKMRVLMQAARDNGLDLNFFIWGQSLFREGKNFCWNDRGKERAAMEQEYRRLAQTYGDLSDNVIVHVGDPGGCDRNGCDPYQTPQEITTFILGEFRKVNPRVRITLSTWANEGFWLGKPGVQFLDETYSPREVGIALHRWYDQDKAKLVRGSGRECDIWGWYLSDDEMNVDMPLHMGRLDKYFSVLPPRASDDIRAVATGLCFHGFPNLINVYVSAQKMWSPQRSLEEIEREFCAGAFGDKNVQALIAAYQAAEKYARPHTCGYFIPETDCVPVAVGTHQYNQELRLALAAGKSVEFDPRHPPKFTLATDGPTMWEDLMRRVSVISVFSDAQEKIKAAKARSADRVELRQIANEAVRKAEPGKLDLEYPVLLSEAESSISYPTGNLLRNPGFEEGAPLYGPDIGSGGAAGWRFRISDVNTYVSPETKTVAYGPLAPFWFHSGKEAVRVSSLRGGRAELLQEATVRPGRKYGAAVWVRALDAAGQGFGKSPGDAAALHIQELDEKGNVLVDHEKVQITKANAAYEQLVYDFETGADTVTVRYLLETDIGCNHWHGRVIYDDAALEAR